MFNSAISEETKIRKESPVTIELKESSVVIASYMGILILETLAGENCQKFF